MEWLTQFPLFSPFAAPLDKLQPRKERWPVPEESILLQVLFHRPSI
jgi:hypothetical protein